MTLRKLFSEYIGNLRDFLHQCADFFADFYLIYKGSLSILDIPLFQFALMVFFVIYVAYFFWCGYESAVIAFNAEYTGQNYTLCIIAAFIGDLIEGLVVALKFSAIIIFVYPLLMILENAH
ncbi:MAG: hypothetical protein GJ671_00545 [Alteromonadaceae bacterium]|nr:hypothetical protein [Alteromonadaceae bacterium]